MNSTSDSHHRPEPEGVWGPPPTRAATPRRTAAETDTPSPTPPTFPLHRSPTTATEPQPGALNPRPQSAVGIRDPLPPPPTPGSRLLSPPPAGFSNPSHRGGSGSPTPRPSGDGAPPPTIDAEPNRTLPTLTVTTGAWLVSAAVAANLAAQNRVNSVATFVAVAIVAGLVVTGRPTRRLADIAPAGIAVSAAALSVFRASPWIVGPAAAVAMTGLVAAAHGVLATDRRLARTALDAIDDLVDTPAWLARPIRATATSTTNRGIARGVVLASLAVLPLTLLLAAADAAFGQLLVGLVQQGFLVHLAISAVLLVPVGGVVLGSRRADRTERSVNPVERSPWFPTMTEGTIVLTAVVVLFGIWGATQVVVALGGAERLLAAANLSAAENARQGFFPLVAVTAIVAGLLVAVDRMTTRATAADRRRFRLLTTIIGVETVGLVVAAFSRLALYIDGFGHTMLRLSVAWFLAFLAVAVIALVVGMNRRSVGVRRSLDSLALLAGVWVLAFGLFGPEAFIANRNIDRSITVSSEAADPPSATGESENRQPQLDATYLASDLGADAVPTVVSRLGELDADSMVAIRDALCLGHDGGSVGIAGWNRAEQRAADAIATLNCR